MNRRATLSHLQVVLCNPVWPILHILNGQMENTSLIVQRLLVGHDPKNIGFKESANTISF